VRIALVPLIASHGIRDRTATVGDNPSGRTSEKAKIMNSTKPMKSILSERSHTRGSARAAGKIRPGTKVLTADAAKNPKARALFEDGRRAGKKSSDIESEIKKLGIERPLRPTNTQEFHVFRSDFVLPIFADKILDVYGEGEGKDRKLLKFPVVFHSIHMHDFFPHALESHSLPDKFRSAFDENGNRVCETLPEVKGEQVDAQRKAGIKRVPRREWQIRSTCEPRVCKEFQGGHCKFRGRLKFFMPLISGLGLVEIETSSEYAAEGIWETLDQVQQTLGYIPTTNPSKPGQPVFMMSKVQEERVYYDSEGKKKGLQWVPRLTVDLDMGALLTAGPSMSEGPTVPKAWLPAMSQEVKVAGGAAVQPADSPSTVNPMLFEIDKMLTACGCDATLFYRFVLRKHGEAWKESDAAIGEVREGLQKSQKYGKDLDLIVRTRLLAADYDIPDDLFGAYTKEKFGDWSKSFPKMREVIKHIEDLFAQGRPSALDVMGSAKDLITQAQ
jgi:hypothetical protein